MLSIQNVEFSNCWLLNMFVSQNVEMLKVDWAEALYKGSVAGVKCITFHFSVRKRF